jgi:hypothetical protein
MKRVVLLVGLFLFSFSRASAQADIIQIIKDAIVKVIRAVDLKIQRLQNETIWLQDAQKVLENTLAKAKLAEIGDWVQKQKDLYGNYFDELQQVKSVIVYYHRIREITDMEARMITNYKRALALFRQDNHFTADEIVYIGEVYAGMIEKSAANLDQVTLVVEALTTSMTDAERMKIIDDAYGAISENYRDLEQFTTENQVLSLRRSKDAQEIDVVKELYGLP